MDKIEKIVLDRNSDFGDPIAVAVTDMSNITYATGRREPVSEEVDGVTFTYQELDSLVNSVPGDFAEPLVQYLPDTGSGEVNPDWHDERFYIRPNMIISVSLYIDSNQRLVTDVRFIVVDSHGEENEIAYIAKIDGQIPHPSRAIRFGYFKQRTDSTPTPTGELSLGVFIVTSENETQHNASLITRWISPNFWDGSFRPTPTTEAHAASVTPTGFSGGRSNESTDHLPGNAYANLGVLRATGNGLHMYRLSMTDYSELMGELWQTGLDPEGLFGQIKNWFFKPTAGMLSLHRLPFAIAGTPVNGVNVCGTRYIKNRGLTAVETQHVPVPSDGSLWRVDLTSDYEWSKSFLDWNPYVLAVVTLPFIGNVEVNVNYFVYGVVGLRYIVDVINGNCLAELFTVDSDDHQLLIGRYAGNCAYTLPLFANEQGGGSIIGVASAVGTTALTIGATIASGGVAAPEVAAGAAAGAQAAAGTAQAAGVMKVTAATVGGAAMAAKSAHTANHITMSGNLPNNVSAIAGDLYPWLHLFYKNDVSILDSEKQDMLQQIMGREASVYCKAGQLEGKGFLSGVFHADNIPEATDDEKSELELLLAQGVYWI